MRETSSHAASASRDRERPERRGPPRRPARSRPAAPRAPPKRVPGPTASPGAAMGPMYTTTPPPVARVRQAPTWTACARRCKVPGDAATGRDVVVATPADRGDGCRVRAVRRAPRRQRAARRTPRRSSGRSAAELGDRVRRIPDGETGPRADWIVWQYPVLSSRPQFEVAPPAPGFYRALPQPPAAATARTAPTSLRAARLRRRGARVLPDVRACSSATASSRAAAASRCRCRRRSPRSAPSSRSRTRPSSSARTRRRWRVELERILDGDPARPARRCSGTRTSSSGCSRATCRRGSPT